MKSIARSFSVAYDYKLYFTKGLFSIENRLFKTILDGYEKKGSVKLLFIVDDGLIPHYPNLVNEIEAYCHNFSESLCYKGSILVTGGESCKNDHQQVEKVLQGINNERIDRHSFVVAIGGGAVIDMVGYAAAIAHRGVKLIRIPTTVLSQNDSAVGVKNSINAFGKKNFLGTFAPPYAIINDTNFLVTLDQRDWISGIAEAIKVALIKDASFFEYIVQNVRSLKERDLELMQEVIYKCAEMHMDHIALGSDPFESGSSRPLDFGHWAAHKMEQMSQYTLKHGEAVAKGIALDITYANLLGLITKDVLDHIIDVMHKIGFDLRIPVETNTDIDILLEGIQEFQEHLGGELCITLLKGIGKKHDVNVICLDTMRKAVNILNEK